MARSDWTMRALADITGLELIRPKVLESTAFGAAALAGYRTGLYPELDTPDDRASMRFVPKMEASERERLLKGWRRAVVATITFAKG